MNNTLATIDDRKVAIREYKNSTATTDKRLTFKEFGTMFGVEQGSAEHRSEFSRYCSARNAEAVAFVEKARASGLTLANSVETIDKVTGELVGVRIAFSKATTPKVKALKNKDLMADFLKLVSSMTPEQRKELDAGLDAIETKLS